MSASLTRRIEPGTATVELRPYEAGDEAELLHVWNTAMWADPLSESAWRSVYLTDPAFRRSLCLVAVAQSRVIGFVLAIAPETAGAVAASPRDAWVVGFGVLPENRRRGVGTSMFERLECSLRERGTSRLVVGPYIPSYVTPGVDVAAYPDAVRFLEQRGAATQSSPLSMKASLTGYRPRPEPEGIGAGDAAEVRGVRAPDIVPCIEFVRQEFPHWVPDVTSVASRIFGGDSRGLSLLIALDGDEPVGFAMSRGERFGPFGVREAARGRGIGSELLAATLMEMRAQGFHCAWFLWTNDRAARLYEGHGFEEVRRFALMTKDVSR